MPDNEPIRLSFGDAAVAETFVADVERRTISGLAVPWGKIARSGGNRWQFGPGSLRWNDPKRVKLNLHHDSERAVGYASALQSGANGLEVQFKIARGEEGDKALSLAEDGVLDGFSIEVDFEEEAGDSYDRDGGIRQVNQAILRGVALTAMPAFDGARVSAVAASRDSGRRQDMAKKNGREPEAEEEEGEEGEGTRFEQSVSELSQNFAKLPDAITKGMQSALEQQNAVLMSALDRIDNGDEDASPQRASRSAWYSFRNDPPVYTFEGNGQGDSLVRDVWNMIYNGNQDARQRYIRFQGQTQNISAKFAMATTANAGEIIPPGYREDLYVAQLIQGRPFVEASSRNTLSTPTAFVLPTFTSATAMSATHVEGVNPSEGTIDFGTRTVTPQGISGRLTVTRELIDSSNPAIDSLVMGAMRESYARQTEAIVYTNLNGANGQGGVITGDFVPSGSQVVTSTGAAAAGNRALLAAIRSQFAKYAFNRFDGPTRGLINQQATSLLAGAVDTTERPLLASVNAQNAAGVGNAAQMSYNVDGIPFTPAWAATSPGAAGDADVFILRETDNLVFESPLLMFQYVEKLGPALIEFALFGYFATHLVRPVGLSAIRHTQT